MSTLVRPSGTDRPAAARRPAGAGATARTAWTSRVRTAVRTVGALALLEVAAVPVSLAASAVSQLTRLGGAPPAAAAPADGVRRTVLVSGGKMSKALELARAFHGAGHRVVMVETARYRLTGHRFSRAVDAFHVVPAPTSPDYAQALLDVVRDEGVDVYVPVCSPVASLADAEARALLDDHCEVVHLDADGLREVDDKYAFFRAAQELGLSVPDTHRVTDAAEVADLLAGPDVDPTRSYVLKSIAYDPVHRLDLTPLPRPTRTETEAVARSLPISPDNPWILQELLEGIEYCTHGTVRDGRLQVYVCCPSSAWQLVYEQVDKPAIREWVETFVKGGGHTGQLSFDFIEAADGTVRAIECNPRTHSAITLLHDDPDLARAYLEDLPPGMAAVEPALGGRPTYWLHHELWHALRHPTTAPARLRTVLRGRDAVLDPRDPLPFLALHHLHVPSLLLGNLRRLAPWLRIDVNIGKLVEPAGD